MDRLATESCGRLEQILLTLPVRSLTYRIEDQEPLKLRRRALWETVLRDQFPKLTTRCISMVDCPTRVDKVGHDERILTLSISPDGKWFASGSQDGTIILWNARTGHVVHEWLADIGAVVFLDFSPVRPHLVSLYENHRMEVWDIINEPRLLVLNHVDGPRHCAWSPDGYSLATGYSPPFSTETGASILEAHSFQRRGTLTVHRPSEQSSRHLPICGVDAQTMAFSPDLRCQWLAVVLAKYKFHTHNVFAHPAGCWVWDTISGNLHGVLDSSCTVMSLQFDTTGTRLLTVGVQLRKRTVAVTVWHVLTKEPLHIIRPNPRSSWSQAVAQLSPAADLLMVATDDNVIQLWDLSMATGNDPPPTLTLRGHTHWVRTARFSPDGRYIASGSFDRTVRLWRTSDGTCLDIFWGHDGPVELVRFTTDERRLVAGVGDGSVLVHHLRDYPPDPEDGSVQALWRRRDSEQEGGRQETARRPQPDVGSGENAGLCRQET
ncbi:WD40-repeat-containing domain protein [Dichomitus squalens]|nr:WD40-repeat-containing domain protein [Dichomitus squalens]